MSSNTELENKSQARNSNNQVSNSHLNECHEENEFSIANITKLPINMNDIFYLKYYILFENESNNCWLNCALALLVNNKTLYWNLVSKNDTILEKILILFRNIMVEINSPVRAFTLARVESASKEIKCVQDLALKYLQPLLKCEDGMLDSPYNAVMNLIGGDAKAQALFDTSFSCNLECDSCKTVERRLHKKSVTTLTMVENFDGSHPVSVCACPVCKIPNQQMYLHYQSLPSCLLFHFENGAGEGVLKQMDFKVGERTYYLTGVINQSNIGLAPHYITWIRDPDSDYWLEYNDLNFKLASFKKLNKEFDRQTIHMLCFESLDQMGVITTNPAQSTSTAVMIEKEKRVLRGLASIEHSVASSEMIEKEKYVLQGATLMEPNGASQEKPSSVIIPQIESNENEKISVRSCKSSKEKVSSDKARVTLTAYEEQRLNATVDLFMYNYVFPFFKQKKK